MAFILCSPEGKLFRSWSSRTIRTTYSTLYHSRWPSKVFKKHKMNSDGQKKRSPSVSYILSLRDGESPRAHSRDYESAMTEKGMSMNTL